MRLSLIILALTLGSCTRLPRNTSPMTTEQLLQRSTHVFIGVIEKHEFPNRFLFRVSGEDGAKWRVIRMKVKVELVLRGVEPRTRIDIYEAFPTGIIWGLELDARQSPLSVSRPAGGWPVSPDARFPAERLPRVQRTA